MEYKKDKRTKNLTLRDIHVGDWVQVWSEQTERYSPPLKIIQICDDGTIYLVTSDEERLTPWVEDIKNADALPIDEDLLRGFGFDVRGKYTDTFGTYQSVYYQGDYLGQLRYAINDTTYLCICGFGCDYMDELTDYMWRNHIDIKLEWKGVKK